MANAPEKTAHDAVRTTIRVAILGQHGLSDCGPLVDGKVDCHDVAGNTTPVRGSDLEREWNRALALGVATRPATPGSPRPLRVGDIAAAIDKAPAGPPSVPARSRSRSRPARRWSTARHANNTWLQEMPDPVTKLVWDNAAILSPATAKALGVESKDVVKIAVGRRSITAGVWVLPGQADNSIALTLGWGRKSAGRIGNGRGFDVYPLRTTRRARLRQRRQVTQDGRTSRTSSPRRRSTAPPRAGRSRTRRRSPSTSRGRTSPSSTRRRRARCRSGTSRTTARATSGA